MEFVRTLKALADPLRLRILAAVAEEELTVGEVQEVVESVQSSVSRNLAILREAGFVQDRKEGTSVYFSARQQMPEPARELFKSLHSRLADIPEVKKDQVRLEETRRRRLQRSQSYFESLAGDWERIRKSYFDDRVTSLAIEKLLPRDLTLADIGCGTGSLDVRAGAFCSKSDRHRSFPGNVAKRARRWPGSASSITSSFARAMRSNCRSVPAASTRRFA